jgi:hypothetical protein
LLFPNPSDFKQQTKAAAAAMQLAEFAASAVLLLLPYNQILPTGMECKGNAMHCSSTDTGANKTVYAIPKKKPKKIEKKNIKKIMHGSRIQSIQSQMVQFATTITTASK